MSKTPPKKCGLTGWPPNVGKSNTLTFYIASKKKNRKEVGDRKLKEVTFTTMQFLLVEMGGATMLEGEGLFLDDDGKRVHREKVTLCTCYTDERTLLACDDKIRRMASGICTELEQDCLSVEINGTLYFYKAYRKYRGKHHAIKKSGKGDYHAYLNADLDWGDDVPDGRPKK